MKKRRKPPPSLGQRIRRQLQAAVNDPPSSFRICGASEPIELLADDSTPAADGKPKLKRFSMVAYTGGQMRLAGFYWPVVVDLEGMSPPNATGPIYANHNANKIVGHWTSVDVSAQRIKVAGVMSGVGKAARNVAALAANAFPWQASIGADATRIEFVDKDETVKVNGRNFTGPLYVARGTTLGEVSFVPRGADSATSATVAATAAQGDTQMFEQWLTARGFDPKTMTDGDKKLLKAAFDAEQKMPPPPAVVPPTPAVPVQAGTMTTEVAAQFKTELDRQLVAAREQQSAELARCQTITTLCASDATATIEVESAGGVKAAVNFAQHAIRAGWTAEKAELEWLRLQQVRAARPQGPFGGAYGDGPHLHFASTPEVSEAVLEAAVLHAARHSFKLDDKDFYFDAELKSRRVPEHIERDVKRDLAARYTEKVNDYAHKLYRGQITPVQVIVAAGRANGYRGPDVMRDEGSVKALLEAQNWRLDRNGLRAEGSSTMSIANVLANVQNKFMLQGYLFVEQTWRQICGIRPVKDFKPTKSINLLGDVEFKALGRNGELENASLGDQAFANQAAPYGRILTIPWTNLVDDDLGILSTAPMKIGQGAGLALNRLVWATFMSPGNGDDGNSFFTTGRTTYSNGTVAANDNYMSGGSSALSSAALATAKKLFDNQVDPNGNPLGFDGAKPILLFPPDLWQTAMELIDPAAVGIVYGGASASRQPNVNLWKGRFEPAMSRYLNKSSISSSYSTTAWWILFNPVALAAIEAAFLGGVDVPTVQQAGPDFQFDRLGISIRGTMPFGVTMQQFRAAVKSAGA